MSVVSFTATLLVGRWSGFFAVSATGWLILSAALIWLVLVIQFHQRTLAEQEKLDIGQLAKGEQSSAIFQAKSERATLFAVAQRRLQILEKMADMYASVNLYGTPSEMVAQLRQQKKILGADHDVLVMPKYGSMSQPEAEASMRLFAREVISQL